MKEEETQQVVDQELENLREDEGIEAQEEQFFNSKEFQEAYGAPEPEEQVNSAAFLHRAAFESPDTVKTTFLSVPELGRPIFTMRFLLDIHDVCKFYIDPLCKNLGLNVEESNRLATYFQEKIRNFSDSGMSHEGFAMNLNVTRKVDATRKRVGNIENLQGGKR